VTNGRFENERSLQGMLQDIKNEIKEFVHTRFEIFKREMQDKLSAYKAAMPMAIAGALFIATAWFLITGAIVAAIALALGWPNRCRIVGVTSAFALGVRTRAPRLKSGPHASIVFFTVHGLMLP